MNPITKVLYRFIYPACAYFSVAVFILTVLNNDPEMKTQALSLGAMMWVWLYALMMAGLGNIFYIKKIALFIQVLLHYLGTMVAFVLIFVVAVANYSNAAGAMIVVVALSVIYFFIAAMILLIRHAIMKNENKGERYKNQFNG